jgi:hypothetical protein
MGRGRVGCRGANIEAELHKIDNLLVRETWGDVGRRSWCCRDAIVGVGQRDNARRSSWAVVGTRVSSWAECRFSPRPSLGRVLGGSPSIP